MQIENELWVSEYSVKQGCFHVETLKDVIAKNRRNMLNKRAADYAIIGIHKSYEDASAAIKDEAHYLGGLF